jgi:hypothetical protein
MTKQNIGIAIHQSVKLVEQAGREINSLVELIKREVDAALVSSGKLWDMKVTESWSDDGRFDDSGWVYTDHGFSLGLARKGDRRSKSYFSIQISLAGDGMSSDVARNEDPLVHVNLWGGDAINFKDGNYLNIDFTDEDDLPVLQDKVLFNWNAEAKLWQDQGWTYSIKLVSLNTMDDIRRKIIEPFTKLIQGKTLEEAGLTQLDGIIRYELTGEGKFRIMTEADLCG